MSNTFNSNENKQKILDIIKGKIQPSLGNIESAFPDDYEYPQKLKDLPKSSVIGEKLRSNKIYLYKTRTIPELATISSIELLPEHLRIYAEEDQGLKSEVVLPIADTNFIPKYKPNYRAYKYDKGLYNQIIYQTLQLDKESYAANTYMIKNMDRAIRDNVYCSGSLDGQLQRLIDMNKIRHQTSPNGKQLRKTCKEFFEPIHKQYVIEYAEKGVANKNMGMTWLETACNIYEQYFPIYSVELDPNWPGLLDAPTSFLRPADFVKDENGIPLIDDAGNMETSREVDFLPAIGGEKAFGPPLEGRSKTQHLTEALILADAFYGDVYNALESKMKMITKPLFLEAYRDMLQKWWYLSAGWYFPKAEIYDRNRVADKTRNIWSMSFVTHMLYTLLLEQPKRYSPNCLIDPDVPSLYRFCPFYGGIDKFVNLVVTATESTAWFYADNIYMVIIEDNKRKYYSLDLVKAESQVQQDDVAFVNYYYLTRGHTMVNGDSAFNVIWASIMLYLIPTFVCDSTGILMNLQFKIPGQGSGNTGTYDNNNQSSVKFLIAWEALGKPTPGSKKWEQVKALSGVDIVVELEDLDFDNSYRKAITGASENGIMGVENTEEPPTKPGVVLKLDCLGYGAVYSNILKCFVPILDEERFAKSLCLSKKMDKIIESEDPATLLARQQYYKLARSLGMMMLGGWNYAPICNALKQHISEAKIALSRLAAPLDKTRMVFDTLEIAQLLEEVKFNETFEVTQEFLTKLFTVEEKRYTDIKGKPYEEIKQYKVKIAQNLTKATERITVKPEDLYKTSFKMELFARLDLYDMLTSMKDSVDGKIDFNDILNSRDIDAIRNNIYLTREVLDINTGDLDKIVNTLGAKQKELEGVVNPYKFNKIPVKFAKNYKLGFGDAKKTTKELKDTKKDTDKVVSKALKPSRIPVRIKTIPEVKAKIQEFEQKPIEFKEKPVENNATFIPKKQKAALMPAFDKDDKKTSKPKLKVIESEISRVPKFNRSKYVAKYPQPEYLFSEDIIKESKRPGQLLVGVLKKQANLLFYLNNPKPWLATLKNVANLSGSVLEDFYEEGVPTPDELMDRYNKFVE